jgi:hypothetical protein
MRDELGSSNGDTRALARTFAFATCFHGNGATVRIFHGFFASSQTERAAWIRRASSSVTVLSSVAARCSLPVVPVCDQLIVLTISTCFEPARAEFVAGSVEIVFGVGSSLIEREF